MWRIKAIVMWKLPLLHDSVFAVQNKKLFQMYGCSNYLFTVIVKHDQS